ncbi:MAG: cyclic nucleotide-binding domain-containing protein [Pseudomonadota bacterium]
MGITILDPNIRKSGIKSLKPGEVLFSENDPANSLFIIQKGQLRLFRPKGKGQVEIGVIHTGEVIGEMAFFDQNARKRSCSAEALVSSDVIEVSFGAFGKALDTLSPWFKTIIQTLARRLRKSNERVKGLESSSAGYGAGATDFKFFMGSDIVKMLSLIYMVAKAHGRAKENKTFFHLNMLKFYYQEVFGVSEPKFNEFMDILKAERHLELTLDENKLPKIIEIPEVEYFRDLMVFFNGQRIAPDDKKIEISSKCEQFLEKIIQLINEKKLEDEKINLDLNPILADFKYRIIPIGVDDLAEALKQGLCQEVIVGKNSEMTSIIHWAKLKKLFPAIRLMNIINHINDVKNRKS